MTGAVRDLPAAAGRWSRVATEQATDVRPRFRPQREPFPFHVAFVEDRLLLRSTPKGVLSTKIQENSISAFCLRAGEGPARISSANRIFQNFRRDDRSRTALSFDAIGNGSRCNRKETSPWLPRSLTLTIKADGSMEGVFATLRVNAPITVVPNTSKASEEAPDYRILNKRTGFEIGAGWNRRSLRSGDEYLSVKLEAPEIGVIFGNVAPAPGGDESKKVILWNNPQ